MLPFSTDRDALIDRLFKDQTSFKLNRQLTSIIGTSLFFLESIFTD
jgi:hypothetical protein